MKTSKQLERCFKGAANHWRIDILLLVHKEGSLRLDAIVEKLRGHHKTLSMHTIKLVQAGLLNKRYEGNAVLHSLSPYGKRFISFIKLF